MAAFYFWIEDTEKWKPKTDIHTLNFLQKSGQISLALCCDFKFVNNKLIKF